VKGRRSSRADPGGLRGNSCRVACHVNIWYLRDRAFSINFRPIFNFSQDALLCHAKQPVAANLVIPGVPSSFSSFFGDPQTFRGCKLRGSSVVLHNECSRRCSLDAIAICIPRRRSYTTYLFIRELFVRSRVNSSTKMSRCQWSWNYKKFYESRRSRLKKMAKNNEIFIISPLVS